MVVAAAVAGLSELAGEVGVVGAGFVAAAGWGVDVEGCGDGDVAAGGAGCCFCCCCWIVADGAEGRSDEDCPSAAGIMQSAAAARGIRETGCFMGLGSL